MDMLRFDCKYCGENVFDVQGIDHLGDLPHEWTCCGCGRIYVAKYNKDGQLIVYKKGYPRGAVKYDVFEFEPIPDPETTGDPDAGDNTPPAGDDPDAGDDPEAGDDPKPVEEATDDNANG